MCVFRAASVEFSGDKRKKSLRVKKVRGGEVKTGLMKVTKRVLHPSVMIRYSFIFARLLSRGVKRKERGPKKEKKKRSVNPLYSKEGESEERKTTEGQLKLMVIYNNLKLTSHCH